MKETTSLFDNAEIIHSFAPEIIPNERKAITYGGALESNLRQFSGTEYYHADSGLLLTDGVSFLLNALQDYTLLDFVRSHLATIAQEEDAFCVIDLSPDGMAQVHNGHEPKTFLAMTKVKVNLPCQVRLFTGIYDRYLVIMLSSEY